MNENTEIDLKNPIFIVYINVDGYTPNRSHDLIERYKRYLNFTNCNFWFIGVKDSTKIELIWKGTDHETPSGVEDIKKINQKISKVVEMISDGVNDQVLKQKLRDFALNDILND